MLAWAMNLGFAAGLQDGSTAAPNYRPKFIKKQNPLIPLEDEFEKALEADKPRPKLRLVPPVDVPEGIEVANAVAEFKTDSKKLLSFLEAGEKERNLKKRIREQDLAYIMSKILNM